MIKLISMIPAYKMFRKFGFPRLLPLNITLSVTYRCNSRCKTCNVYRKKVEEFTLEEFDKTFQSIGSSPYWLTISGGEPFLRKDIVELCLSAYKNCQPKIMNIATNGILSDFIFEGVKRIVKNMPETDVIVNLSLDDIGDRHDEIRGVKDNFVRAVETFTKLKELEDANLTVGIHTVISKYNVGNFPEIYRELIKLDPDSYVTEIAEERVELETVGQDIAPSLKDYSGAVNFLTERIKERRYGGISRITQAFRLQYYELVKKILEKNRQILPCYAGFISAQIAPDGDVWACCTKAGKMGSLRKEKYDFRKAWFSEEAQKIRGPIRQRQCFCPLANASYTNMLVSYRTMAAVLKHMGLSKREDT